jgi:hypothetical protein
MALGETSRVGRRTFLRDATAIPAAAIPAAAITFPIALMPLENLCNLDRVAVHRTQTSP